MESITIPVGPRLGDIVIEAKNLRKAYGDRVLMDNLSFSIPPGSVVGAQHTRACFLWYHSIYGRIQHVDARQLCRETRRHVCFQHYDCHIDK